jgi:PIN domain nuclease of toxin-antitoxin system
MGRTEQPGLVHLDTHVVIWLYEGRVEAISPTARTLIERGRCVISPMVRLELQYLFEIGRTVLDADSVLVALRKDMELDIADGDFDAVVKTSLSLNWTRDVFDRLITAQALQEGEVLVTRDRKIRDNCSAAVW